MGEIKLVTTIVFFLVFTISIISYAGNYASDNSAQINLNDDSQISSLSSNLQSNLSTFRTQTNSSSKAFFESTIESGDETTATGGQFKVGISSLVTSITLVSTIIFQKIFGGNPAFGVLITAFLGLLIYIGIRYIWKTWKGGNPD